MTRVRDDDAIAIRIGSGAVGDQVGVAAIGDWDTNSPAAGAGMHPMQAEERTML